MTDPTSIRRFRLTPAWLIYGLVSLSRSARFLCTLLPCWLLLCCAAAKAEPTSFYLVWGTQDNWDGSLEISEGRLLDVQPFRFEANRGDQIVSTDEYKVTWRSSPRGNVRGIRVRAELGTSGSLHFKAAAGERTIKAGEIPAAGNPDKVIRFSTAKESLLFVGRGDPSQGPRLPQGIPLPPLFVPPVPKDPIPLADTPSGGTVTISLSRAAPGAIAVRRGARGDGRLYLEVYSPAGPLQGDCHVEQAGKVVADRKVSGSLWLCRPPRIGTLALEITEPDAGGVKGGKGGKRTTKLVAPTTLVEVRGRSLFVNGEPLLVKGTLPGDLSDEDAAYLKSLGANTIRTAKTEYLQRYQFLGVVPVHGWPEHFCEKVQSDEEFRQILDGRIAERLDTYRPVMSNPWLLVLQLANEQVMGVDRWAGHLGLRPFDRLDYMLARCYNAYKPLDPMVPLGYSNCAFGYRTPGFLDIYLHNTYLGKDRGWPPLAEFARFEGCDDRPFLHTEFGSNVYLPQVHSHGPNTPVMEKLQAWNYPQRWAEYSRAGAIGGINYRLFDGRADVDKEKAFTNFGVMTFDHKPKLACWELWHLWRDFELRRLDAAAGAALQVDLRRDYAARDCRLTIEDGGNKDVLPLADFAPRGGRTVSLPKLPASFRWRIDYTTHGGLPMVACGAQPASREAKEFLARLADRPTYPLLRELFDAEVVAADGRRDVGTLQEMERPNGVVTVCFRKPNGTVYVAAFTRKSNGKNTKTADLEVAFARRVTEVDELTGQPVARPVEVEPLDSGLGIKGPGIKGLRIKHVTVPYLPARYSQRLLTPVRMPVFRIDSQEGK